MENILHTLLNMSVSACLLTAAAIIFRLVFKKAPRWISCALWGVVGARLALPINFKTVVGLLPARAPITRQGLNIGIPAVDNTSAYLVNEVMVPAVSGSAEKPIADFIWKITMVWLAGLAVMVICAAISCARVYRSVRASVKVEDNFFVCDDIKTPFILGMFRPKIYLPSGLDEAARAGVIAHERAHLSRRDNLWKPVGYAILSVYWFNPAVWIAYALLCRDIELACDEKVIKNMTREQIAGYSETLLSLGTRRRTVAVCPLAFGEVGVRQRVKSALSYKKPALWIIIAALVAAAVAAVCLGTQRSGDDDPVIVSPAFVAADVENVVYNGEEMGIDEAVGKIMLDEHGGGRFPAEVVTEGHVIMGVGKVTGGIEAYLQTCISGFNFVNGCFMDSTGFACPAVMHFKAQGENYVYEKTVFPRDGSYYGKDIKRMFPLRFHEKIFGEGYGDIWKQCVSQAQSYLDSIGRQAKICSYADIDHILLEDVGMPVETENNFVLNTNYPFEVGTAEYIESGVRYVYETAVDEAAGTVICTKTEYDSGNLIEQFVYDLKTGELLSANSNPAPAG